MDDRTLKAYDKNPSGYVKTWLEQYTPEEIHQIVEKFFHKNSPTADIGSGSGREVNWFNENGYPCVGFDASVGLLNEAKKRFPKYEFTYATLPLLKEIKDSSFDNILCETVLMHLPKNDIPLSCQNLFRILKKNGVLSLSWRLPAVTGKEREDDDRLFTLIEFSDIEKFLPKHEILLQNQITSSSSGKSIRQFVARKV